MNEHELEDLVGKIKSHKYESQTIELKSANKGTPKRLYDTLSAFANQPGGGTIIFGISEGDDYAVVGVYDVQDLQIRLMEQCKLMTPILSPVFVVASIENKLVVAATISEVAQIEKPCFYTPLGRLRGSFKRVGSADVSMSEYEVYSLESYKQRKSDELQVVDSSSLDEIDQDKQARYLLPLLQSKPNLRSQPPQKVLQLLNLVKDEKPTLAALLLFGIFPQGHFPQLSITAVVIPGTQFEATTTRFIDNKRFDGSLWEMFEGTLAFVLRNIKTKTVIDGGVRRDIEEYPTVAIREIILNCLIHRDYSLYTINSPIRILIFADRIEFINPGSLFGRSTIATLESGSHDTRNPVIASVMETLGYCENRFSGIPTIIAAMKRAGLRPPMFENGSDYFKVTLYNSPALSPAAEEILSFCKTPRTRDEIYKALAKISKYYFYQLHINPLIESGLLKPTLPGKATGRHQKYRS